MTQSEVKPHNVDDLLASSVPDDSTTPDAPEGSTNEADNQRENNQEKRAEIPDELPEHSENDSENTGEAEEPEEKAEKKETESNLDEYGNEKPKDKMYTDEEVKERINAAVRERLARLERNSGTEQQQQIQKQAQKDFEYDENSSETWQQQLEAFIEQTHEKMYAKRAAQSQQAIEQQNQAIFEEKFREGAEKFKDFRDVVSKQPITDAMTLAARGISDPAAFFYAAAKRMPEELKRISKIADPYAQITEMGKLEVKLRKGKQGTQAPKPVTKTKDDMPIKDTGTKKPTIDDLLAQADSKRWGRLKGMPQGSRRKR